MYMYVSLQLARYAAAINSCKYVFAFSGATSSINKRLGTLQKSRIERWPGIEGDVTIYTWDMIYVSLFQALLFGFLERNRTLTYSKKTNSNDRSKCLMFQFNVQS